MINSPFTGQLQKQLLLISNSHGNFSNSNYIYVLSVPKHNQATNEIMTSVSKHNPSTNATMTIVNMVIDNVAPLLNYFL